MGVSLDDIGNALGSIPGVSVADKVVETFEKATGIDGFLSGGGAADLTGAIKQALKAILSDKDLLKEFAKLIAEAADHIVQGLAEGIGSVAKDLSTAIKTFINTALDKLLDALGN